MAELGNKHQCPDCETRFYDLGAEKAICPKCGTDAVTGEPAEAEPPAADSSDKK